MIIFNILLQMQTNVQENYALNFFFQLNSLRSSCCQRSLRFEKHDLFYCGLSALFPMLWLEADRLMLFMSLKWDQDYKKRNERKSRSWCRREFFISFTHGKVIQILEIKHSNFWNHWQAHIKLFLPLRRENSSFSFCLFQPHEYRLCIITSFISSALIAKENEVSKQTKCRSWFCAAFERVSPIFSLFTRTFAKPQFRVLTIVIENMA